MKFSLYAPHAGGTHFIIDEGTQMSGASPTLVPKNSGGATPTMSKMVSPSLSLRLSTAGSRARARFHQE